MSIIKKSFRTLKTSFILLKSIQLLMLYINIVKKGSTILKPVSKA